MALLAVGTDAKTYKGERKGILTGILYMTPAQTAEDAANLCPFSTVACRTVCINVQGQGVTSTVQAGRARKRRLFLTDRAEFLRQITAEARALERRAIRRNLRPAVRLNGTTDVAWELLAPSLFTDAPTVAYYDYTKIPARMHRMLAGKFPPNYTLTFSRSESNDADCLAILKAGGNVAVVFDTPKGQPLPKTWRRYHVVDGDLSDARILDPHNVVVGLRAKGTGRRDQTGFVVRTHRKAA